MIVSIKESNNELKYHQKISPNQYISSIPSLSDDIDLTIQLLTKLKVRENETILPKVKKNEEYYGSGLASQLSTIS